jgi:hypothetical protein
MDDKNIPTTKGEPLEKGLVVERIPPPIPDVPGRIPCGATVERRPPPPHPKPTSDKSPKEG